MPGFTPGRRYQPPFMPFQRQPFKKRVLAKIELAVKGPAIRMPHVRQLPPARDGFHLPDGMPKGFAQRTLRRLDARKMLRGRIASVHLVQDLRTVIQTWARSIIARSAAAHGLEKSGDGLLGRRVRTGWKNRIENHRLGSDFGEA
jgi:hypothetical protein